MRSHGRIGRPTLTPQPCSVLLPQVQAHPVSAALSPSQHPEGVGGNENVSPKLFEGSCVAFMCMSDALFPAVGPLTFSLVRDTWE